MSDVPAVHSNLSLWKWRILDYKKCGKPNNLSGQRIGEFQVHKMHYIDEKGQERYASLVIAGGAIWGIFSLRSRAPKLPQPQAAV